MLKKLTNKIKIIYANRNWNNKRRYLIGCGAKIGEGTRLNCKIDSFGSEPYLIEVGKDCLFADQVQLITHDGGVKVLNTLNFFNGEKMDKFGKILIGDNTYLGLGVYIMPGVRIGNNCIIGAGAVVTKNIPDNSIAVGLPAKVISSIDEYYLKSKDNFVPTGRMNKEDKMNYLIKP